VLGLLYVTDAAVQVIKEQGSGHLVNTSSVAGRKSGPLRGAYPGTKFAVNAISEAPRQELIEDNVRVTVVGPGAVETELPDHTTDEEAREGIQIVYGLDTILQPEDIANARAYCVVQPKRVSVSEVLIRPTQQGN
jgi:hypothetical protein